VSITYPLSLPTNKSPAQVTMRSVNIVSENRSPFSGVRQVYVHQGKWWEAEVTLPPMNRADAEQWISFLVKLGGKEGTFLMGDPSATTPRGSAATAPGTPLVNGASQTGDELVIDGCPNSATGYLLAGDYIQLGTGASSFLFKVVDDANTDGSGNLTVTVWPDLNTRNQPLNNAAVTVTSAKGLWALNLNSPDWNAAPFDYGVTFPAIGIV